MKKRFKTAAQVIVPFIILFFLMQLLGAFIRWLQGVKMTEEKYKGQTKRIWYQQGFKTGFITAIEKIRFDFKRGATRDEVNPRLDSILKELK